MRALTLRLDEATYERLREEAFEKRTTITALIRGALAARSPQPAPSVTTEQVHARYGDGERGAIPRRTERPASTAPDAPPPSKAGTSTGRAALAAAGVGETTVEWGVRWDDSLEPETTYGEYRSAEHARRAIERYRSQTGHGGRVFTREVATSEWQEVDQ